MKYLNYFNKNNILSHEGLTAYYPNFFKSDSINTYDKLLNQIDWKPDKLTLFGKTIITKRKVAFEGDDQIEYTYSKQKKTASPWSNIVLEIKNKVEEELKVTFNACLLNYYEKGDISMAWHSDNEPELIPDGIIASISFGVTRTFQLKHKQTGEKIDIKWENGSLLLMDMESQQHWLHQLKKEMKVKEPRINLTFRQFKK
jgi:alkylated DNA repair dioxygenase AlkB